MTDRSLADLLEGCRRGHEPAQQAFYERFYRYALSVCLAYANDREDAREILNDGFLKAFRGIGDLKSVDGLLPWLRRIMVNTAVDHYRKDLKRGRTVSIDTLAHPLTEPTWNDDAVLARLSAEDILRELHQLPVPYRLVFSLYVLEGYAHREIAGRLHIAESTSRAHLTEANRLLRRALASHTPQNHERTDG